MKIVNKILGAGLLALALILCAPKISKAQEGSYISDQDFYDDLAPYGTWVSDSQYGNVWIPDAEDDFRPYATRGHWIYTDYGNTWVSEYPWGWATFHYGRWRFDDYYGWEWIPGHRWAPAWVSWRHGGGYYGWAPLTPGISISISIGGGYHIPDNYWVCAPQAYINRPNIYNYYALPSRSVTIIHNTTIINNTYVNNNQTYITGPRQQEIRNVTHHPVQVFKINNISNTTIVNNNIHNTVINNNNHTINIFRPAVKQVQNARPQRVVDGAAYKQQNPNLAIAHRGNPAAGPAFNHTNAAKLAVVAKTPAPDNKMVHVNPAPNKPGNRPGQPAAQVSPANPQGQPNRGQHGQQPQVQPARQQQVQQPDDRRHGQNVQKQQVPPNQPQAQKPQPQPRQPAQQQAQQQVQQQQAQQHAQQAAQQQAQQHAQQAAQQQAQQHAQQAAQQHAQQAAQQQAQQHAQQAAQQQAQQHAQQEAQQQAQQHAQQAAQQQAQQHAQQAAQQQAQQHAQQAAQQQAQQRAQQAAQQQAQQHAQQAAQQQAQQRAQQAAQQHAQQTQQHQPKPKPQPTPPPNN